SGKAGYTAPSVTGQAKVISAALAASGVSPDRIGYVEAHGTATPLGDPIEVAALTEAFRRGTDRTGFCLLGSVKTNLGHLDAAAGVTGLIKAVLALQHRQIPPSLHCTAPNPVIDFAASPFRVADRLTDWKAIGQPRRAGVSAFGIGGTNVHAVLEEAPPTAPSGPSRPWQVLLLSAVTPSALEQMTDGLADRLEGDPGLQGLPDLADAAYTLRMGRRTFAHRRAVVAASVEEAAAALRSRDPQRVWTAGQEAGHRPVAFLLPGVGDQYPGMARGLYQDEPVFRREIDLCAGLLLPHLGLDLRDALFSSEETEQDSAAGPDLRSLLGRGDHRREPTGLLQETRITQPAMFAVGYALARLWMSWGAQPQALLGYSLGEYTAACLAGVMELPDALALVARRARLIGELAPGAMLAVPLSEEETRARLGGPWGSGLSLAAVNAPAVSVVAGPPAAIAALESRLAAEGLPARRLQAAQAFHSVMMQPIAGALLELVRSTPLAPPRIPYLSNVTGTWIEPAQATDPGYWVRHLLSTVRFADSIAELWREPGRVLLEMGPGQTLGSLALQQIPAGGAADRTALSSLRHALDRQPDQRFLLHSLGRLWLAGAEIDWSGFQGEERRRRVPLPTYPFERRRFWIERGSRGSLSRPAGTGTLERLADMAAWFRAPSWKRTPRLRSSAPVALGGRWLVLLDELGLGDRLAQRLTEAGCEVVTARAGQGADLGAGLGDWLAGLGEVPDRIVHLWSLGAPEERREAGETLERGYQTLISLAQALAGRRQRGQQGQQGQQGPAEICVIANGLCDVEREDPLHPEKATLLGPLRVIPQEHPGIACRLIDIDAGEIGTELAARLLAELAQPPTAPPAAPMMAWRGPHCWLPAFEPVPLAPVAGRPALLKQGGTYLITGGLGGIGLALAGHLWRTA
ncbi:MAG TPA: type I polyketide synthase, partial [Thermoanaerobaculia bacterium]